MNHTAWQVLYLILLILGAVCFAVAALWREHPPFAPYRLRFVAGGLLLWIVEVILITGKAI